MNSQIMQRLIPAVLGGFLIGSSLIASAEEIAQPGVIRITDSRPKGMPLHNVGYGHKRKGEFHPMPGYGDGSAYGVSGGCPHCKGSGCPHCFGNCPSGHCKHGGKHGCHYGYCHLKGKLHGMFQEHYCCHAPDYGFSAPGKSPIYRQSVQYNQYFPNAWYGTPGGSIAPGVVYPTVYMPTDTTQLGYYYQHVPFWMPNPNALPPRPIPAQWHVLNPAPGFGWGAGWGGGSCPPGNGVMNGTVTTVPMNGDQPTPITTPLPTVVEPAPVPVQEDAPAPVPDASAQNQQIRRANLQN